MVAFHFPPFTGSSGVQRTLRFAQQLPAFGWEPLVLTATESAYEQTRGDLEVPRELVIRRAFAFDAARQLSIAGRYPGLLARPDRWMTWQFDGMRVGARMIQQFKPLAIWSTYPIATAHVIAARLRARFGLPWIADFRDPMVQDNYPPEPKRRASFQRVEETTLRSASMSVFTTPGAAREYERRYPEARICVIENGYDEESFAAVEDEAARLGPLVRGAVTIVHSGIVYPSERDPTQLMAALARLKASSGLLNSGERLLIRFRAPAHDRLLASLAARYGVSDLIEISPPVPYREALVEMLRADALLVLQASNCNQQVPAKLYEYLRARRPLLLLTDPAGDTAAVAARAGVSEVARLDDAEQITQLLARFVSHPNCRNLFVPSESAIGAASRRARTAALAARLNDVAMPQGPSRGLDGSTSRPSWTPARR